MVNKKATKKKLAKHQAFPPAYFLSLTLENVRCFGPEQTIDVSDGRGRPAQWTVILGDNNAGKTTLLQCFAAIEPIQSHDENKPYPRYLFVSSERRYRLLRSERKDKLSIHSQVCLGAKISELENRIETNIVDLTADKISAGSASYQKNYGGLKCYGYGASRIMGESTLSEKESADATASLFRDDVELINAEEWLLQADYSAKASKTSSRIGQIARKKRDQIREVLINLLPEVNDIRVTRPTERNLKPQVEFETPYGWIKLDGLSLGYRAMITWMVDLASRMFDRYPRSRNPLAEPAIVLIDEIDLHLHPKWQRTIMRYLSERFVNTQFIVTAHSPLVVQAAANANIVLLRREGDHVIIDNNPLSVLGWRTDQILTSLFGLESSRSIEIEKLQKQRRKILSKAKITKGDEEKLSKLESQMGDLPVAETPEDIEAMDIIRKAAKSLKKRGDGKK